MSILKRLSCLALMIVMVLGIAACHPQNEAALTINGQDITSAYYMCALIQADGEASSKVTSDMELAGEDTTDIDYGSKTLDEKPFYTWVKDRAIELCATQVIARQKFEELGFSLTDSDLSTVSSYADYFWNSYGYSAIYEPNGVSYDTFKKYYEGTYIYTMYFDKLYGVDGSKAVSDEDLKAFMKENFVLADVMESSLLDDEGNALPEEDKEEKIDAFNAYAELLMNPYSTNTFDDLYYNENGSSLKEDIEDSEGNVNQDPYAKLLGSIDMGDYASDYYDDVKDLAVGAAAAIESDDESSVALIYVLDIDSDTYYITNYRSNLLSLFKQDEYDEDMKKLASEATITENTYATGNMDPKKLSY